MELAIAAGLRKNVLVKLWKRLSIAAGGLYISGYGGYLMLSRKVFAYQDMNRRAVIFSPGLIATGILIAALAFVPTEIVERLLGAEKRKSKIYPHYHRDHNDSPTQE